MKPHRKTLSRRSTSTGRQEHQEDSQDEERPHHHHHHADKEDISDAQRVENEFQRIKNEHWPLTCLFGLSHPTILEQKNDLLQTTAETFNFVILSIDKIIGMWKDPPAKKSTSHSHHEGPTLAEMAREQGHQLIAKSNYKRDMILTEGELCLIIKYAIVAYCKKDKYDYSGFLLDSFPVNPTETHTLETTVYPIALGFYLHPTHHEREVSLPINFRRPIGYSEKLCREVAAHRGRKVVEILHPAALDHRKIKDDLIPVITQILEEYRKNLAEHEQNVQRRMTIVAQRRQTQHQQSGEK